MLVGGAGEGEMGGGGGGRWGEGGELEEEELGAGEEGRGFGVGEGGLEVREEGGELLFGHFEMWVWRVMGWVGVEVVMVDGGGGRLVGW